MSANHYILISAGGVGTRVWPISRTSLPKQFQRLGTEDTLIQHMVSLAKQVVPLERICIMTVPEFASIVQEQLPDLPKENIFIEPARRDNGPATVLGMLMLKQRDPNAVAAILWADHLIKDASAFSSMLSTAFAAAEEHPHSLVTVGANPDSPDIGMGYIRMGKEVAEYGTSKVFQVREFIEKPDLHTARRFVASWEYLWNVGYKVMSVGTFIDQFTAVQPDLKNLITNLEKSLQAGESVSALYDEFPKLSIEYLYTQYLKDILVVPSEMGWSDVGNWNVLHEVLRQEDETLVTQGPVSSINSDNTLVLAKDKRIALVGVHNLIIVDAGDTILVMDKNATADIKTLIAQLGETNPELL